MPSSIHSAILGAGSSTVVGTSNPYTSDTGVNPSTGGSEPSGASLVSYSSLSGTFYQRESATGASKQMSLAPGNYTLPGFTSNVYATAVTSCGGLVGAGSSLSVIAIGQNTSDSNASAYSNLLRFNNSNIVLQDLQLQGTYQSTAPYYAGIMINGNDPTLTRVKLLSADPGNDSAPPGETFGINMYSGSGGTLTDVEIDARAAGSQTAGASLFATNSWSGNVTYTRCYAHNGNYSAGWALWQTNGNITMTDCVVDACRCFWNLERCSGTFTLIRPRIGSLQAATSGWANNPQSAHAIVAESDATWGAASSQAFRFIIQDPRNLDGTPYNGSKLLVQFISAHDGGTQYYGSNNFEAYDGSGNDIKSSIFTFSGGGYN